ncbi:MAG: hypothetical protein RMJ37_00670 [Spirochaetia bacterium]|nr:hypothetical protein [Spirochaetota bacterium]MCX8096040.1 hypothetical protein [Spirochaetota bacterium]MDW8111835.1 hypothetical protein [Spirochaetia bacterium]
MIAVFANGFGETVIANKLSNRISEYGKDVILFSLVGNVNVNDKVIIGFKPRNLGSSGRTFHSITNFLSDLKSGSLFEVLRFIKAIRKYENIKTAVIIGDPFLLFIAKTFIRGNPTIIFNSIYKSEMIERHFWFEKSFIKRYVNHFIPRDRYTSEVFSKLGINTVYFGNPMVDSVDILGIEYRKDPKLKTLLLLPGSTDTAYRIMPKLLYVVESVFRKFGFFNVLCSLSSRIIPDNMKKYVIHHGWELLKGDGINILKKDLIEVIVGVNTFGDMLSQSDVVLSCAGTATEQSAGFGKPTIMFIDKDTGLSKKWFRRQAILLGENLRIFKSFNISDISDEIVLLFNDAAERERRGRIGMKMIEGKGSINKMAEFISTLS